MSLKGAQVPWHLPPKQNMWAIAQLVVADTQQLLISCHVPGPCQATWNDPSVRKCYLNLKRNL